MLRRSPAKHASGPQLLQQKKMKVRVTAGGPDAGQRQQQLRQRQQQLRQPLWQPLQQPVWQPKQTPQKPKQTPPWQANRTLQQHQRLLKHPRRKQHQPVDTRGRMPAPALPGDPTPGHPELRRADELEIAFGA